MTEKSLIDNLSPAQVLLMCGQWKDSRVFLKDGMVLIDFHCGNTSITRALQRKGICSPSVRVRAGKRRVKLTELGERVLARLNLERGE